MTFENVIGHNVTKKHLTELVQQNRLSHALLFLGKEGSGSLAMALAFSQYIVCTSAKDKNENIQAALFEAPAKHLKKPEVTDACGHCPACIKAQQFIHPDIHFSFPVIPKKAGTPPVSDDYINEWREFITSNVYGNVYDWLQFLDAENKQGNMTAEECNQINHKLSLKSFESDYKILIVWMPEFLGNNSNRLLKLIEEPPPDTLFIFVAQDEALILPTILSRTQLIKIPSYSDSEIENALINLSNTAAERATQVAGLSRGNYREALHLLQNAEYDWESLAREWMNIILKKNNAAQLKWIDEINQMGREKQKQFIRYFIYLISQAIHLRFIDETHNTFSHLPEDKIDFAIRLNKMCTIEAQEAIINELNVAIFYIERNANAKMLFHALSIRFYYIIKDNSLILMD